jgi:hypothetical protein
VQTGKPLDLHIPDTVVLVDGHPTWLRSTKTTSLIPSPYTHRVVTVPTSQSRWKRQFKRETCPHFSSPLSSLTREQLLAPVAVIRSHSHHQCSHASVVLQAVYDVMVKEHVAGSRPECVQAFVRNKGLKPCVYRVVWKRGKSSHALVMTSRHLFDKVNLYWREVSLRLAVALNTCVTPMMTTVRKRYTTCLDSLPGFPYWC